MGCKGVASERGLRAPFRSGAQSAPTEGARTIQGGYRLGSPCTWRASGLFCQPPGPTWPSSRA
eukprot:scaffold45366_cov30-Phaeocystis_antarctica.AAC.1